jgi:hypothetical protein
MKLGIWFYAVNNRKLSVVQAPPRWLMTAAKWLVKTVMKVFSIFPCQAVLYVVSCYAVPFTAMYMDHKTM